MGIVYQTDKRTGVTYAYENQSFWNPELKRSKSKRKLIGRVDSETKEIIPTDGRCKKRSPSYVPVEGEYVMPVLTEDTTVMHDHCSLNYHQGFIFKNVECIQHLERDLQKIADISNHEWPTALKELMKSKIHESKELIANEVKSYTLAEVNDFFHKVSSILDKAEGEWYSVQSKYYSNDEKALINRLNQYKYNYFAWIKDFTIPTTNNLSDRSLRFVKTKDKFSGQFQSIEYASYFADIRTYLETCSRNGVNEFAYRASYFTDSYYRQ